jgi:hypothetical protein
MTPLLAALRDVLNAAVRAETEAVPSSAHAATQMSQSQSQQQQLKQKRGPTVDWLSRPILAAVFGTATLTRFLLALRPAAVHGALICSSSSSSNRGGDVLKEWDKVAAGGVETLAIAFSQTQLGLNEKIGWACCGKCYQHGLFHK